MVVQGERGQSAIELALVLPVLILITVGCLDLGRAFAVKMTLANGAREGARYASMFPTEDPDVLRARTEADILAQGLDAANLDVRVYPPATVDGGQPIKVTATYSLPMVTSFLTGGQPLVVRASAQMVILGGD